MTEQEWVENCNPHEILLFLRDKATDRGLCTSPGLPSAEPGFVAKMVD
jgi:hypothetical protein